MHLYIGVETAIAGESPEFARIELSSEFIKRLHLLSEFAYDNDAETVVSSCDELEWESTKNLEFALTKMVVGHKTLQFTSVVQGTTQIIYTSIVTINDLLSAIDAVEQGTELSIAGFSKHDGNIFHIVTADDLFRLENTLGALVKLQIKCD